MIEDLSGLSDEEFERERQRLILEEIRRSPAHQQKSLLALQASLDVLRETVGPTEFLHALARMMSENLENLDDLLRYLKTVREEP